MADNTFDDIYSAHFLYVRKFLLRLCKGNEYIADELAQETFFQAHISIHRFEENCRVETWLCSIAQNVFYSFLRKEKKQMHFAKIKTLDENAGYLIPEERGLEHDIAIIINQLSPVTSKVLSYRLFQDMPYSEISVVLGISESSAKVIYHRGRKKLKSILEKEYGYEI